MGREAEETFKQALERRFECQARFIEAVPITETFEGEIVWEGIVHVFNLEGSSEGERAYAWSYVDDAMREVTVTVLHSPPVDSPLAAVQGWIVDQARKGRA